MSSASHPLDHLHPTRPGVAPVPPLEAPEDWAWWHDPVNPEQDRLHRMLIASPWERYLLDRRESPRER